MKILRSHNPTAIFIAFNHHIYSSSGEKLHHLLIIIFIALIRCEQKQLLQFRFFQLFFAYVKDKILCIHSICLFLFAEDRILYSILNFSFLDIQNFFSFEKFYGKQIFTTFVQEFPQYKTLF